MVLCSVLLGFIGLCVVFRFLCSVVWLGFIVCCCFVILMMLFFVLLKDLNWVVVLWCLIIGVVVVWIICGRVLVCICSVGLVFVICLVWF